MAIENSIDNKSLKLRQHHLKFSIVLGEAIIISNRKVKNFGTSKNSTSLLLCVKRDYEFKIIECNFFKF